MIADLRGLKSMMEKIQPFVDGIQMTMGNEKLYTRFVDPAHIALTEMTLQIEDCCIEPFNFDIDLYKTFYKIKNLPLGELRKKESPDNYIKIQVDDEKKMLTFSHPLMTFKKKINTFTDGEKSYYPSSKVPDISLSAYANINVQQLKLFLKIAKSETEHLTFIAKRKEGKLHVEYENKDDELTETDLTYALGGIEGINLEFKGKSVDSVKSLFSIDYMQNLIAHLHAPMMRIGLANDNPLTVWWNERSVLSGMYMLAPKIECD